MGVEYKQGETETWKQPEAGAEAEAGAGGVTVKAAFEVEGSYPTGQGIVFSGKVKGGTLKKAMHCVVQGRKAKIMDLSVGLKPVKSAQPGERVSILLERAAGSFIRHGDTLQFATGK